MILAPPTSPLFPYTTLFRSTVAFLAAWGLDRLVERWGAARARRGRERSGRRRLAPVAASGGPAGAAVPRAARSEEHTSELQSQSKLVCRLLPEKKKHSLTER